MPATKTPRNKLKLKMKREELLEYCMFCGATLVDKNGKLQAHDCGASASGGVVSMARPVRCPLCGEVVQGSHTCQET